MRDPLYLYGDEPYEENENVILIPKELVFTEAFAKLPGDAQILYFVMLEYLNDAEEKGGLMTKECSILNFQSRKL